MNADATGYATLVLLAALLAIAIFGTAVWIFDAVTRHIERTEYTEVEQLRAARAVTGRTEL